jgi:hypothetical protein
MKLTIESYPKASADQGNLISSPLLTNRASRRIPTFSPSRRTCHLNAAGILPARWTF